MKNNVWRSANAALVLFAVTTQAGCLNGSSADAGIEENDGIAEVELPLQAAEAPKVSQEQLEALAAAGDWEFAFSQAPLTLEAPPPSSTRRPTPSSRRFSNRQRTIPPGMPRTANATRRCT